MGKVRYGLSNVHYALHKTGAEGGETTFDTPKRIPGAVKMTITPEGNSSKFFADNGPYETFETNSGYTGELEIAVLEDSAALDLLGELKDTNGGVYEASDSKPAPFVMLFEIDGNVTQQRFALYNCKLSRPTGEHNTVAEETTPDTVTLSFTAIPLEITVGDVKKNVTKYSIEKTEENSAQYDTFFTTVMTPSGAAA